MRFPHLLGNERLKKAFLSVKADKIGPAVILSGPSGCGKLTAAKDLAQAILCTGNDAPCGVCPSCVRFKAGTNSDFELLGDGSSVPGVSEVREFRSRSFVKSGDSGIKVFIIANADKLNAQSQNALLKVLEEPYNTVFILTCENHLSLLPTVLSRCTVYGVDPLPEETVVSELLKSGKHSKEEIQNAAGICGGSLKKARDLLEQGVPSYKKFAESFISLLDDEFALFSLSKDLASLSREEYSLFCESSSELISDRLLICHNPEKIIKIYDYLDEQLKLMPLNPSVTSLSSALTAFCGELSEE